MSSESYNYLPAIIAIPLFAMQACAFGLVVGSSVYAVSTLGPIDLGRSLYNVAVGDNLALKSDLVEYVRRGVKKRNSKYKESDVEKILANTYGVNLENGKIDSNHVDIEKLWDAAEEYARSPYERWVWSSLDKDYTEP